MDGSPEGNKVRTSLFCSLVPLSDGVKPSRSLFFCFSTQLWDLYYEVAKLLVSDVSPDACLLERH